MVDKKNIYAAFLVGGSGTRFWPKSRKKMPKQFLNITGDGTLFEKTLRRIKTKVNPGNIFIVTNKLYQKEIVKQIGPWKIPRANILLEPEAKNTGPAVCWVSAVIHKKNPEATILVLPSDHLILNQKRYEKIIDEAVALAQEDCLVTLGIVPTRPETGYGYLKTKEVLIKKKKFIKVDKFVEKPDLAKATQYLKRKNYYWNSGMFVWRSDVILKEFQTHLPALYAILDQGSSQKSVEKNWSRIKGISVDYGILEKSSKVMAVKAQGIDWSDLGSWESLTAFLGKDKNQNILKGDVVQIDCSDSFVWADKKLIAAIGLKDIIVVDTPDALLICKKEKSQDVREIINHLKKQKRPQI